MTHQRYIKTEALSGIILLVAAITGFILSNSPLQLYYHAFINMPVNIGIGSLNYTKPTIFWINDGLVSIFFLFIDLEIKELILANNTSITKQLTLPFSAAIGGVIIPGLIYTLFNYDNPINMRGWAIPTAMDTAFILGILALLGSNISKGLKIFIISLSIMDDILAVLVIAIFYADELSSLAIIASATILGALVLINQAGITRTWVYIVLGFILWLLVLGSGVHTSIAGVLLAMTIPNGSDNHRSLLASMKVKLRPWVFFGILPLFAFANTDVDLKYVNIEQIFNPLSLGIIFGLFIGKQLGVFGASYLMIAKSSAQIPNGTTWLQMYGASILCGVGFTMSLFIGVLAFESGGPDYNHIVKVSVFIGSIISALCGFLILKKTKGHNIQK